MHRIVVCLAVLLTVAFAGATHAQESLFVQQAATGIYQDSSTLSEQVGELNAGDEVTVVERWGAWIHVEAAETSPAGWVLSDRLGAAPPAPESDEVTEIATEVVAIPLNLYRVEIDGPNRMLFRMTCTYLSAIGEYDSRVWVREYPHVFTIRGQQLTCNVRRDDPTEAQGPVEIRVFVDDTLVDRFRTVAFGRHRFRF